MRMVWVIRIFSLNDALSQSWSDIIIAETLLIFVSKSTHDFIKDCMVKLPVNILDIQIEIHVGT